jgi:putative nucleotidyltransferase with HDIG domain
LLADASSSQTFDGPLGTARVLVVDDEEVIRTVLQAALQDDFRLAFAESAEQALRFMERTGADVLLVDKNLPGRSGLELLRQVKQRWTESEVIVMTGYASLESAIEALRLGAYDYLMKPFDDLALVIEKVRRAAEKRELQLERRQLIDQLLASNQELIQAQERLRLGYFETLAGMAAALEARDAYTQGHSERVATFSVVLARELGMREEQVAAIRDAALLHDVGKIGIREDILNKPGRLTPQEFAHIQTHPEVGASILGKMEAVRHLVPAVLHHHERFDGKGYPHGLAGSSIPLEARIMSVADCFDAMTSKRPYRDGLPFEEAVETIRQCSGTQLDPTVVGAFLISRTRGTIHP